MPVGLSRDGGWVSFSQELWSEGAWSVPSPISKMVRAGEVDKVPSIRDLANRPRPTGGGMPRVGSAGRLAQLDEYTGGVLPRSTSFERLKDLGTMRQDYPGNAMQRDRSYDRLDRIYDSMSSERIRRERSFDKIQQASGRGQGPMPRTMSSEHLGRLVKNEPPETQDSPLRHNPYADPGQGASLADRLNGMPRVGNGMSRNSSHNSLAGLLDRPRLGSLSREGSRQNLATMDHEEFDEGCLLGDTLFVFPN